ncbi:hypothetical protein HPT29_021155 [Microvirga terrae]|uniref:Uncharacterized protein n=1 Tax=Microvirga terrae TaxID=2740529 RepID=A0ABY5RNY8_9HYPH|nr:hypothetical protein [Microvirga terrae]UVF18955.1 hypothetical protein HPT29_021155 [Microvirga terrae]
MTAMTDERPIFENEEWLVIESGLEHKRTGYFIDRESIGQRREDGLWTWPLHMAEKSWCTMQPFSEAFSCAASVYGVTTGAELAHTFKMARCEISPWPKAARAAHRSANPVPLIPQTLHSQGSNPIFIEPRSSEKSLNGQGFQSPDDVWRMRPRTDARLFLKSLRKRSERPSLVREAELPWRAQRRIRKTGTKLVRLLQAAWTTR